jgi:hypothetical protein
MGNCLHLSRRPALQSLPRVRSYIAALAWLSIFAASTFVGSQLLRALNGHAVLKALSFAGTLNAQRLLWPFPEQFAVTLDKSVMLELREPLAGRVSSTQRGRKAIVRFCDSRMRVMAAQQRHHRAPEVVRP